MITVDQTIFFLIQEYRSYAPVQPDNPFNPEIVHPTLLLVCLITQKEAIVFKDLKQWIVFSTESLIGKLCKLD